MVRALLVLRGSRERNALHTLNLPASPHAIMRRACPYLGENMGPARMRESLTIREQPRSISDVAPRRLQGGGVGEVISSNHPDWKTGDIAESYSYPSSCHPTEKEMERTPSGVATRPGVPAFFSKVLRAY